MICNRQAGLQQKSRKVSYQRVLQDKRRDPEQFSMHLEGERFAVLQVYQALLADSKIGNRRSG